MRNRAGASGSLELGAREVSIVPDVGHVALQVAFGLGGAFDGPPPNCWTHMHSSVPSNTHAQSCVVAALAFTAGCSTDGTLAP